MTKCILVVEDQEDLRGILRDLLTSSGTRKFKLERREGFQRSPAFHMPSR
jgi:hypothetical protein